MYISTLYINKYTYIYMCVLYNGFQQRPNGTQQNRLQKLQLEAPVLRLQTKTPTFRSHWGS